MKYNLSAIMKRAHKLHKTTMMTSRFSTCLSESWKIAKAELNKQTFTGKKTIEHRGYEFKFWQGGRNRRIYINGTRTYGSLLKLLPLMPNTRER